MRKGRSGDYNRKSYHNIEWVESQVPRLQSDVPHNLRAVGIQLLRRASVVSSVIVGVPSAGRKQIALVSPAVIVSTLIVSLVEIVTVVAAAAVNSGPSQQMGVAGALVNVDQGLPLEKAREIVEDREEDDRKNEVARTEVVAEIGRVGKESGN